LPIFAPKKFAKIFGKTGKTITNNFYYTMEGVEEIKKFLQKGKINYVLE
jgi:hypothetical protein